MSRAPLFDRLPEAWKRLDQGGILESYLGVWDNELDRIHALIEALLDLRSIDRVPDRYLALLGPLVGSLWDNTRSHDWNRQRIADAIRRHSYKGTLARMDDEVYDKGSTDWSVIDQSSRLIVLDRQGGLDEEDCHFESPDYWQEGAFILTVNDDVDRDSLRAVLSEILPAGERWYYTAKHDVQASFEADTNSHLVGVIDSTNAFAFDFDVGDLDGNIWEDDWSAGFCRAQVAQSSSGGVSGGFLTVDSPLSINNANIDVTMGTGSNPLPEALAVLQTDSKIV